MWNEDESKARRRRELESDIDSLKRDLSYAVHDLNSARADNSYNPTNDNQSRVYAAESRVDSIQRQITDKESQLNWL